MKHAPRGRRLTFCTSTSTPPSPFSCSHQRDHHSHLLQDQSVSLPPGPPPPGYGWLGTVWICRSRGRRQGMDKQLLSIHGTKNAVPTRPYSSHIPASKVKPGPDKVKIQMSKGRHAVINGDLSYLCHYLRSQTGISMLPIKGRGRNRGATVTSSC